MRSHIGILVNEKFRGEIPRDWAKKIVQQVLKAEGVTSPYEVGLVITDFEAVKRLNREYRGKNEPTDVLAFYMVDQEEVGNSFAVPPDGVNRLGEVIISYPQATAQAEEQGHPVEREILLLIVHGLLHLLGYDHEKPLEAEKMRKREKELLESCTSGQSDII